MSKVVQKFKMNKFVGPNCQNSPSFVHCTLKSLDLVAIFDRFQNLGIRKNNKKSIKVALSCTVYCIT